MRWRIAGFALWGALAGAAAGAAVGALLSGPNPGTGATPEERSRFLAERVSETANCAAAFGLVGVPIGSLVGWRTARKSAAAR